jgi:GAF domain-containing protein
MESNRSSRDAGAGLHQANPDDMKSLLQAAKTSQEPIRAALSTGQPVIVRNIFTDAEHKHWQKEAAKLGYAAFVVLPLPGSQSPSGVLMIYAAEADAFDSEEMELLKQLVSDISPRNDAPENKKGE